MGPDPVASQSFPIVLVAFFLLVIVGIIFAIISRSKEIDANTHWAQQRGFVYNKNTFGGFSGGLVSSVDPSLAWTQMFHPFGEGHSQRAQDLFQGQPSGLGFTCFEYSYKTGSGKDEHTYIFGVACFDVPFSFPAMSLSYENFFTRIGSSLGMSDIQFESADFNNRYRVSGNDKKFVFDLIHPQMMEFLMSFQAPWDWQFCTNKIVLTTARPFTLSEMDFMLEVIPQFMDLIPDYMKRDQGLQPNA